MKRTSLRTAAMLGSSAAFAFTLLTAAAIGGPMCAKPQDEIALKTADVQQFLMVAALTCNETSAYNRFVRSHQSELQESDHNLLHYFMENSARTGDDDYNAFKTWLANAASMRSIHDPYFCRAAEATFDAARDGSVADLVSHERPPIRLSYRSCMAQPRMNEAEADDSDDDGPSRQAWLGR